MKVSPEKLIESAGIFKDAGQETDVIVRKLENQVEELSQEWEDVNQEAFYQYFQEWHQHMLGFSDLLNMISTEMEDMAERYSRLLE